MTSSGLGRHSSRPILEWDDVELDDVEETELAVADVASRDTVNAADPRTASGPDTKTKGEAGSPWNAMRKLFKR